MASRDASHDASYDLLRLALVRLNRVHDYTSVKQQSTHEALSSGFVAAFGASAQDSFVRHAARHYASAHSYFQEHLNMPEPEAIMGMFERAAEATTATSHAPSPDFAKLFVHLRITSNTFNTPERMHTGLAAATRYLSHLDMGRAFDTCTLLAAAEPRVFASRSQEGCAYAHALWPTALAAANPFVTQQSRAALLSLRWSTQLFEHQYRAAQEQPLQPGPVPLLSDTQMMQCFAYAYRTLKVHADGEADCDSPETDTLRAYKLFETMHAVVGQMAHASPGHPVLEAWMGRHRDQHESLRISINAQCATLSHPHTSPLEPLPHDTNRTLGFEVLQPNTQRLLGPSDVLLALPWVKQLEWGLKRALQGAATNAKTAGSPPMGAPSNRAYCLSGAPGTGKTEAIKYILGQFAAASVAPDARAQGWHGPLLCVALDSSELLGSYYNESAAKIRKVFHDIRVEAARKGGVAAVFVDEVDRFLMGGDVMAQREDDKNLGEFTRLLDNSINDNTLFFLCATNRFNDLAPAARSRLNVNQVAYETPQALRSFAVSDLAARVAPQSGNVAARAGRGARAQAQQLQPLGPSHVHGHSAHVAVLGALCAHLTLRDICALGDLFVPRENNAPAPSSADNVFLFHRKLYTLTAHAQASGLSQDHITLLQGPHNAEQGTCSIDFLESQPAMQSRLQEGQRQSGSKTAHIHSVLGPHSSVSLFLHEGGLYLFVAKKPGSTAMRYLVRRYSFFANNAPAHIAAQRALARAATPMVPIFDGGDAQLLVLPPQVVPIAEFAPPRGDKKLQCYFGFDVTSQRARNNIAQPGLEGLFNRAH